MTDSKEESKKEEKTLAQVDINDIGKKFVEHFYTLFDNNRLQLRDLYVK